MPSLQEIEAALHAYYGALDRQLDLGGEEFATQVRAMHAALKSAEMVRAEESKTIRDR
jgi:hypothetical protein